MAKERGRPRGDRDDVIVKIDRKIVVMARMLAVFHGVRMAELLSGMLDGPVMAAYADMIRQMPPDTGRTGVPPDPDSGLSRPALPKRGGK